MMKKRLSSREKVQILLAQTKGLISIDDVQAAFGVSREKAYTMLWYLTKEQWIRKLKDGLYRVVPLEFPDATLTDENPWLVANELFSPCYIGGWTAANFWGLTEQLFIKTWVMTTHAVHKKTRSIAQHDYILKQVKNEYLFGTKGEWIEDNKILISDPHKTLLDFLNFPEDYTAQSMIELFQAYLLSEHKNISLLEQYARKVTNYTLLKRLGFLLELLAPEEAELIDFCHKNISKGYSALSSQSHCTKFIKRWNLKVPMQLARGPGHDKKR